MMTRPQVTRFMAATVALIALVNVFIFFFTPMTGDDWAYYSAFCGDHRMIDSWWRYPLWAAGHWLSTNGRLGNLLYPPVFALPRIVYCLICAGMLALMYRQSLRANVTGVKQSLLMSMVFTSCLFFALPWWDSMTIFDCQANYIWTSGLVMLAFNILTSDNIHHSRLSTAGYAAVSLMAGASHEAASMPLCVGLATYYLLRRKWPPHPVRVPLIAFCAGTVFVTLSPGIIMRAGAAITPDDTPVVLALKSVPAVILMAAVIAVMLCGQRSRRVLRDLSSTPVVVLAVASLVSAVIAVSSGVVGRSGWFAEIYSFIVLFAIMSRFITARNRACDAVAVLIAVLMVAQASLTLLWQIDLGREHDRFEQLYTDTGSDVIYMDVTPDDSVPVWLIGRFRGVPDPDDVYQLKTFVAAHRPGAPMPVIIPEDAADTDLSDCDPTILSDGSFVTSHLPAGTRTHATDREKIDMYLYDRDGTEWIAQPFIYNGKLLYRCSRRIIDPGDR